MIIPVCDGTGTLSIECDGIAHPITVELRGTDDKDSWRELVLLIQMLLDYYLRPRSGDELPFEDIIGSVV
jgi:hypothetical protein